ncbi:hypothetical protein OPT61_g4312 [Boeremia exigua]|uniref:Uncharacterized protein n=1 Tax=Boeremia exigua TaxID=749465 RepID=A0ACC2IEI8_9PLEO|nr:hypothetical protein OPT61_g4312 [Boeremia exigua]
MYLTKSSSILPRDEANSNKSGIQVICAWPVSGQYGVGTRIAYYILIATATWLGRYGKLRDAVLAAVLVLPTVAGIHGIVLAAVHVEGAVDLDILGAFQICSIGALASSVSLSPMRELVGMGRYFRLFLNGIMMAGLLSLAIEFFRASSVHCTHDDYGNLLSSNPQEFPYNRAACALTCSTDFGPYSVIRTGTASDINVVPAPRKLSFSAGILISVACCIYISMPFFDIGLRAIEHTGVRQSVTKSASNDRDEMKISAIFTRAFLGVVEVFFLAILASLAIVVIGELNLFSAEVIYQTEPFVTIGQWGPVIGVTLGIIGPLYIVLVPQSQEPVDSSEGHLESIEHPTVGSNPELSASLSSRQAFVIFVAQVPDESSAPCPWRTWPGFYENLAHINEVLRWKQASEMQTHERSAQHSLRVTLHPSKGWIILVNGVSVRTFYAATNIIRQSTKDNGWTIDSPRTLERTNAIAWNDLTNNKSDIPEFAEPKVWSLPLAQAQSNRTDSAAASIHFIRHAQGYHNVDGDQTIPDPDLTPKGQDQCKHLSKTFPYFDRIDLVCASPIRRAIQTASISMEPYLRSGHNKILALPLAQEAPAEPANTPSGIKRLQDEYGAIVNFERCLEFTDYDSKTGTFAPDGKSLEARAMTLRKFLRDREEEEIVVVSHGQFLHYVSRDVDDEGKQINGDWENTEYRSYIFWPVDHEDATLKETDESVKRRNASGPGKQMGSADDV